MFRSLQFTGANPHVDALASTKRFLPVQLVFMDVKSKLNPVNIVWIQYTSGRESAGLKHYLEARFLASPASRMCCSEQRPLM